MAHAKTFITSGRQQLCCLDRILDLSAIQLDPGQPVKVCISKMGDLHGLCASSKELVPDLAARRFVELSVTEREVNAGFECGIHLFEALEG